MSDTPDPSPWSAPRWRCPASDQFLTNRYALVGLTLTSSPDRPPEPTEARGLQEPAQDLDVLNEILCWSISTRQSAGNRWAWVNSSANQLFVDLVRGNDSRLRHGCSHAREYTPNNWMPSHLHASARICYGERCSPRTGDQPRLRRRFAQPASTPAGRRAPAGSAPPFGVRPTSRHEGQHAQTVMARVAVITGATSGMGLATASCSWPRRLRVHHRTETWEDWTRRSPPSATT